MAIEPDCETLGHPLQANMHPARVPSIDRTVVGWRRHPNCEGIPHSPLNGAPSGTDSPNFRGSESQWDSRTHRILRIALSALCNPGLFSVNPLGLICLRGYNLQALATDDRWTLLWQVRVARLSGDSWIVVSGIGDSGWWRIVDARLPYDTRRCDGILRGTVGRLLIRVGLVLAVGILIRTSTHKPQTDRSCDKESDRFQSGR